MESFNAERQFDLAGEIIHASVKARAEAVREVLGT